MKFVTVGEGISDSPNALLSTNVKIGVCVTVNTATHLGHDVSILDFSSVMANVDAGGLPSLRRRRLRGVKGNYTSKKKIGHKATVGTGSVVIRNVGKNYRIYGNPAKMIIRP